jgi:hypothetical protein
MIRYKIINPVTKTIIEVFKNYSDAAKVTNELNQAVKEMYDDESYYKIVTNED